MDPNENSGKSNPAPARILPAVELDFLAGRPVPPGLGKTQVQARLLPPMAGELTPPPEES